MSDHHTYHDIAKILRKVEVDGFALRHAPALNIVKEVALAAVTQNGLALQFAHSSLQNDNHVVMAAVTQNGLALQFAHSSLQNDNHVVMAAVTQNGLALQFAHSSLRNKCGVVMAAVTQNNNAFHYACDGVVNLNHSLRAYAGFYPKFRDAHMDGCHRENCEHCKSYYSK